jgi:diaminopimelate decarboxylase
VATVAARMGKRAPVAFRVNPDVDAKTHPYISTGLKQNKFGVAFGEAERLYREAVRLAQVEVVGIGCHIGSLMGSAGPFIDAAARILALAQRLEAGGIRLAHIDLGGGFGIRYRDESPAPIGEFLDGALGVLADRKEKLIVDPGRAIVGNAGVLLTRVEYVKPGAEKNFLVVDAAMNDLIRPALYGAWHDVLPVRQAEGAAVNAVYDIVGPVCESADFLAKDRRLAARSADLLAVMSAGAYAMAMSSNYNTRPRAAEVLVDGGKAHLARRRERTEELYTGESVLPW